MSEAPLEQGFVPAAALTVCVDFRNPQSYLAIQPTRELEARLGIEADWLPLLVAAPVKPRAVAANEDRGTRHRRIRAEYYAHDLERYAQARGLTLGDYCRATDGVVAALGLVYAQRAGYDPAARYVDAVFDCHFARGDHIDDVATIARLLAGAGVDTTDFAREQTALREQFDTLQVAFKAAGVNSAPAYFAGGELFYGRAHLPMIEWQLSGRTGQIPI